MSLTSCQSILTMENSGVKKSNVVTSCQKDTFFAACNATLLRDKLLSILHV